MEDHEDKAWLLRNRFDPFGIPGRVAMNDGVVSFTLGREAADAGLLWLEERLGRKGLAEELEREQEIEVFSYDLANCEVVWPITGGGLLMVVAARKESWVISHDHLPAPASAVLGTFHLSSGRGRARAWKKALASVRPEGAED